MSRPIKSIHDAEGDIRNLKRLARVMLHFSETAHQVESDEVVFLGEVLFGMAARIEAGLDAYFGSGRAVKP